MGFSGDTTSHVIWRLLNGELDGIKPKAAVLLIGTNNTYEKFLHSAEQTFMGIRKVVEILNEKQPQCKIILVGILPSNAYGWNKDPQKKVRADLAVNEMLEKFYRGNDKVQYLSVSHVFFKDGKLRSEIFYDARLPGGRVGPLHPDTIGQRKMAEAIEPVLKKIFE